MRRPRYSYGNRKQFDVICLMEVVRHVDNLAFFFEVMCGVGEGTSFRGNVQCHFHRYYWVDPVHVYSVIGLSNII